MLSKFLGEKQAIYNEMGPANNTSDWDISSSISGAEGRCVYKGKMSKKYDFDFVLLRCVPFPALSRESSAYLGKQTNCEHVDVVS